MYLIFLNQMVYQKNLELEQLSNNSWVETGMSTADEDQLSGDLISDGSEGEENEDFIDLTDEGNHVMRAPENHFGPVTIGTTVTSLWNLNTSLARRMESQAQGSSTLKGLTPQHIQEPPSLATLLDSGDSIVFEKSRSRSGRYKIRRFSRPLRQQPTTTQAPTLRFLRGQLIAPQLESQAPSPRATTCHGLGNIRL